MRLLFLSFIAGICATGYCLAAAADGGPLILQVRVVEGEGASYPAGSRSVRGITVEITDEAGQPVSGAAVSFRLPEDGPSGLFQNGTRTDIAATAANGRATVWGMKWNRTSGALTVRVMAAKGETRAGTLVRQILVEPAQVVASRKQEEARYRVRPGRRWIWVSTLAAAAAGGGLAFGARAGGGGGGTVSTSGVSGGVTIGSPTISVGR